MIRMTKDEYIARFGGLKPTKSKYNNKKTDKNDSIAEGNRAAQLRLMEKAGLISNLKEQVWIDVLPSQYIDGKCVEREVRYKADFIYTDNETGQQVVEDKKGYKTKDYIIKRKLLLYLHGIRIKET